MGIKHLKWAFVWWIVIGCIGLYLRGLPIGAFPMFFQYKFWVHAHSHIALLGWVFSALYVLMVNAYVPKESQIRFVNLFYIVQLANIGMAISFPVQGYGAVSITFSTLFIICSYVFVSRLLFYVKQNSEITANNKVLIKWALIFLGVSTLGAWLLGPIIALGYKGMPIYRLSIYFFLHFLINGWIVLALISLFRHRLIKKNETELELKKWIYILVLSVIATYSLSGLWLKPGLVFNVIGAIAALFQLISIYKIFIKQAFKIMVLETESTLIRYILGVMILALVLKLLLQLVSDFPAIAVLAEAHQVFIIAYLHLVFLGFATPALLYLIITNDFVYSKKRLSAGLVFFIAGFTVSEFVLIWSGFIQAFQFPLISHLNQYLFFASSSLLVGSVIIFFSIKNIQRTDINV